MALQMVSSSNLFFPNQIQPGSRKAPDCELYPPGNSQEWGHHSLVAQPPTSWLNSTEMVAQHIPYCWLSKAEISKYHTVICIGKVK